jgi:hypothetical protein
MNLRTDGESMIRCLATPYVVGVFLFPSREDVLWGNDDADLSSGFFSSKKK